MIREAIRNAPIGRRMMMAALLTTGVVLLSVSLMLIVRGMFEWRSRIISDLSTYASMIGANAAPAVMFNDPKAAADTLSALAAKPSIRYAAIYDTNGKQLALFKPDDSDAGAPPDLPAVDQHRFTLRSVELTKRIVFKGDQLGVLYLQSSLHEMYQALTRDTALIILAAVLAFFAGRTLFKRLQHGIVEPIGNLAKAMQGISREQNYALRVRVASKDEVGMLSEAFNDMLAHIESRDQQLEQHRSHLEGEVDRRTAQLSDTNALLQQQLAERQRAETELQGYTQQIELLSQMGGVLRTCLAADEIYTAVGQFMTRLFPQWTGTLFLLNNSKILLEGVASWGAATTQLVFAPNDCWAMRGGQLHVSEMRATAPRCAHVDKLVESSLCVPLTAQAEMLGIMNLQRSHGASTPAEQRLFGRIAGEIAQALANLTLRDALKRLAIRDPLTGMFNRRYLEEYLEMETGRARRKGSQLSLVMIDLDNFKWFNDTFGHDAGDAALRELSAFFSRHVRAGDAACRYGGEEFILAMWESPLDAATERAETMRREVKNLHVSSGGRSLGALTFSVGIATFPEHGGTGTELINAADRALYRAKAEGRDRVCIAAPPAAPMQMRQ